MKDLRLSAETQIKSPCYKREDTLDNSGTVQTKRRTEWQKSWASSESQKVKKKKKKNPWLQQVLSIRVCFCDMKVTYKPPLARSVWQQTRPWSWLLPCNRASRATCSVKSCLLHVSQQAGTQGKRTKQTTIKHLLFLQNIVNLPPDPPEQHKAGSSGDFE